MIKKGLKPRDLYEIKRVGEADVSADGRWLVYGVKRLDEKEDRSLTDLYLCNLATLESKRITNSGKDSAPRFAPDGKRIAFISGRQGQKKIYILDLAGGEAWQLPTQEAVGSDLLWFPDGKRLAFTAQVFSKPAAWEPYPGAPAYDKERLEEMAKRNEDKEKAGKEEQKKQNNVKVVTRLSYRRDGLGYFGEKRTQVFVTDVPERTPTEEREAAAWQVTKGDFDYGFPTVSPCGRFLVTAARCTARADYDQKSDLWLWDLENKSNHLLYEGPGPVWGPQWSPDGHTIAFAGHDFSYNVSTTTDLWLVDVALWLSGLARGQVRQPLQAAQAINVTRPFDRPLGAHGGTELRYGGDSMFWDRGELYFIMSDRGAGGIYRTDLEGRVKPLLTDASSAITGIAGGSGRLVYTASKPDCIEELYLWEQEPKPIAKVNEAFLTRVKMARWEKLVYESVPGVSIDGWIVYPLDYKEGQKYPLLLLIHGGPHSAYGPSFQFLAQVFAARGYAVLFTNPRGSTTYGQEFAASIDKNWGVIDYADIMKGVDVVLARGLADPANVFVHGWSFGGYMTCWLVTQTQRFKAACGGAVVANLLSGYGTSDIIWADEYEYGGQPWHDYEHLIKHSPLGHVEKVETPLLLLHGENDLRCPIGQSEEFYAALKRLGKDVVMIRYPGEYHGLQRPLHQVDRYTRLLAWFDYHKEAN